MAEKRKNKVEFGLRNAHYAVMTAKGQYGEVKPIPGSVELSLEPSGDLLEFKADDTTYYATQNNQGYEGTMTFALVPDEFKQDCLGETINEDGVVEEKSTALSKNFALMFQFAGDQHNVRHVLYSCVANRPTVASSTKDSGEPNTTELTFRALPRETDDVIKRKTNENTTDEVYESWFDKVYEPKTASTVAGV